MRACKTISKRGLQKLIDAADRGWEDPINQYAWLLGQLNVRVKGMEKIQGAAVDVE